MKLFHLLGFTKKLVFGSSASATRLNMFYVCFLDGPHFFKEPAGIVCHAFEAYSRVYILLELPVICFLPVIIFFV